MLARDLLDAGRHADAGDVLGKALESDPEDGELLLLDGRIRFAGGDLLGAQAALLKAARSLPRNKEPFRWLGEVLLKRGDPARAAKVLSRARAIDANDRAIHLLEERALRLSEVAARAGSEEAARQARASYEPRAEPQRPADSEPPEERTVIRTDLTEQLRSMTAAADEAAAAPPLTAPSPDAFSADFEDEPTNVVGDEAVLDAMQHVRGRVASEPVSGEYEPATVMEPVRSKTSTSPGAAAAPIPPPPKRDLRPKKPSDSPFGASDDEIDSALGALSGKKKSAFADVADPFAPAPPMPPRGGMPKAPPLPPKRPLAAAPPAEPAEEKLAPPPFAVTADPFAAPDLDPEPAVEAPVLEEPERPRGPAPEPSPPALDASPPEPAADAPLGGESKENVDQILRMLKDEGLFEPPTGTATGWANRAEVKKSERGGTRVGVWLGVVWVLALLAGGGGWFGWQEWLEYRHAEAARFVAMATEEAYGGDHADLVDAERHLREARDLHPQDTSGPTLLLFVHSQRALEDGAFEAGYLRPSIARAERMEGEEIEAYLQAARAVMTAAEGGFEQARERIGQALEARPDDPAILYLAGRLEQRLGEDDALGHLEAASEAEEALNAPRIALAEARYDEGRAEEALALLDEVLARDDEHLRAGLWRRFMTSDSDEPAAALSSLLELEEGLADLGAPTDHVLFQLTKARLSRREGNTEAAGDAVDAALRAGGSEPRLLSLVATEGRRAGRLVASEMAARQAVERAPSNPEFRKLLAGIQLARRNGRAALATLADMDASDPDVLEMRAESALLVGTEEALTAAAQGLDAYVEGTEDPGVGVQALRIRTHVGLGQAQEMLSEARALVREAPGDPSAALALGEAALALYEPETAVEALDQVVRADSEHAEGHYLLGRAKRMAGDAEGAEAALRRALELTPEHTEAKLALGGLLLDMGSFEAADTLYTSLARSGRSTSGRAVTVAGRLGRVEALVGLGRLDDAQVQLEALTDDVREAPSARITAARLAIAQGRNGEAVQALQPLARGESPAPSVLALYADALLAVGQAEPASEASAAALEADAGLPEALVGQAELAVRSEREDDALELLGRAQRVLEQRIRPPAMHARIHTLAGRAHLLRGRSGEEDARTALRRAIESEAAPPEAHFFLGEALAGENSPDARASYERYLELAPEGAFAARARRAIR